jgi:hypothetical protein
MTRVIHDFQHQLEMKDREITKLGERLDKLEQRLSAATATTAPLSTHPSRKTSFGLEQSSVPSSGRRRPRPLAVEEQEYEPSSRRYDDEKLPSVVFLPNNNEDGPIPKEIFIVQGEFDDDGEELTVSPDSMYHREAYELLDTVITPKKRHGFMATNKVLPREQELESKQQAPRLLLATHKVLPREQELDAILR